MEVKLVNPFLEAFLIVMPQVGFSNIEKKGMHLKDKNIKSIGVMINIGIVGDIKGNIIYSMDMESAKEIASKMMMGAPVKELDDMAQSAISELTNMLTANASMKLSEIGININISTPTLIYGEEFAIKLNTDNTLVIDISIDNIPIEVNIAFEKK